MVSFPQKVRPDDLWDPFQPGLFYAFVIFTFSLFWEFTNFVKRLLEIQTLKISIFWLQVTWHNRHTAGSLSTHPTSCHRFQAKGMVINLQPPPRTCLSRRQTAQNGTGDASGHPCGAGSPQEQGSTAPHSAGKTAIHEWPGFINPDCLVCAQLTACSLHILHRSSLVPCNCTEQGSRGMTRGG